MTASVGERSRAARALLLLLSTALAGASCGARTGLTERTSAADGGRCPSAPTAPRACRAWRVDGSEQLLSPPAGEGSISVGGAPVVTSSCDVLVSWVTHSGARPSTLTYSTRLVGFDGAPHGDVQPQPALTLQTSTSATMPLAFGRGGAAALAVDSSGCRFVALAATGAARGPAVARSTAACVALAADGAGFSFLEASTSAAQTPAALVRLGASGALRARQSLGVPGGRLLWDRLTFDDGSFVHNTFGEDITTTIYTNWLQHIGADGAPLAAERVVAAETAPVHLAATGSGILAAWSTSSLISAAPFDRDVSGAGVPRRIARSRSALYGLSLTAVPNGDVLLLWKAAAAGGGLDVFALALAPDGAPRAAAVRLAQVSGTSRVFAVVEASAERALLVHRDGGVVRALPLACVP